MFGYVRPDRSHLSDPAWESYQAAYCGLCHCLKRRCGFAARFTLQYDFVFLCLLLEDRGEETVCRRRCAAHPWRPRPCLAATPAMELCADRSVILAYYKLADGVADETGPTRLKSRAARWALGRAYRSARGRQPDFDRHVALCLGDLDRLERENSPRMDRVADAFARLLAGAAPETGAGGLDRPRRELLYHLGRWIYLADGVDDLPRDLAKGRYNPVAARFGPEPDLTYLATTMTHSLSLAQSAFQLLPRTRRGELLENILYLGLPHVQALVLAGKWDGGRKRGRRDQP